MKSTQIIIFLCVLALFLAASCYVFYRIWRLIPPSPAAKAVVIAGGILVTGAFFAAMLARNSGLPVPLISAMFRIGTSWVIIFLYLLIVFLIADLLRVTRLLPIDEIMYANWLSLSILAAGIVVVFATGNINYHNKKRIELTVVAGNAPVPVRMVAVSDLHLGYGTGRRELSRWVDLINSEKPDIVIIAGDIVDTTVRPLELNGTANELRRLKAPLGVWMAPGNHEYISGIDPSIAFLERAGIGVLRDSLVTVGGLVNIAGRDDATNDRRKNIAALVASADRSLPLVLIDHQPNGLDESEAAGVDFQFSGHTHRGQVWPVTWITDAIFERSHGLLQKGGTTYWVSSGLGIWGGKFRIGSRSEYVVVNIVPKT